MDEYTYNYKSNAASDAGAFFTRAHCKFLLSFLGGFLFSIVCSLCWFVCWSVCMQVWLFACMLVTRWIHLGCTDRSFDWEFCESEPAGDLKAALQCDDEFRWHKRCAGLLPSQRSYANRMYANTNQCMSMSLGFV